MKNIGKTKFIIANHNTQNKTELSKVNNKFLLPFLVNTRVYIIHKIIEVSLLSQQVDPSESHTFRERNIGRAMKGSDYWPYSTEKLGLIVAEDMNSNSF